MFQKFAGEKNELEYAYHHIQEFTNNTQTYESSVEQSTVSGGGNDFESGLDGLMQTIVCKGMECYDLKSLYFKIKKYLKLGLVNFDYFLFKT